MEAVCENLIRIDKVEAVLIYSRGRILKEYCKDESLLSKKFPINSITKTVVSLLLGIAIDKGCIKSVKQDIRDFIKEAKPASLEDHLNMTSGIDWGNDVVREIYNEELINSSSWVDYINSKEIREDCKNRFKYSGASSHLLAKAVSEASGMSLEEFAKAYLFGPLCIEALENPEKIEYSLSNFKWESSSFWDKDPQGNNIGSFGLRLGARDLLNIGKLILDRGEFNGKRVVSSSYIDDMTNHTVKAGLLNYGYHIWIRKIRGTRCFSALGYGNQYLSILPDFEAVIVILSRNDGSESAEIEKKHGELVHALSVL